MSETPRDNVVEFPTPTRDPYEDEDMPEAGFVRSHTMRDVSDTSSTYEVTNRHVIGGKVVTTVLLDGEPAQFVRSESNN